jgi:hypothetical protein
VDVFEGGDAETDPEYLAMMAAIFSQEGRKAARLAADEHWPALSGVDKILSRTFIRYSEGRAYTIQNAGYIVAKLMRDDPEFGYDKKGENVPCAPGCIAKTGALWLPKST